MGFLMFSFKVTFKDKINENHVPQGDPHENKARVSVSHPDYQKM